MYSHVVTIGCTGMLLKAVETLAGSCKILTSIAHTRRSLRALDAAVAGADCAHHAVSLDWLEPDFVDVVAAAVGQVGEPDLVLAWLHEDTLGPRLATGLAPARKTCAFFHVRGSAAANPADAADAFLRGQTVPANVGYHQIILGFHVDADGPRWLYNSEICAGVLDAISRPQAISMVGTVTPWDSHP